MKIRYGDLKKIIREELDACEGCSCAVDEKYVGFDKLKRSLTHQKGVADPAGLAASIGRKKHGTKKFQKAAAKGKKLRGEADVAEVAPPGREKQVKRLKKVPGIDNPWAVAWSQHNKHGKPDK